MIAAILKIDKNRMSRELLIHYFSNCYYWTRLDKAVILDEVLIHATH